MESSSYSDKRRHFISKRPELTFLGCSKTASCLQFKRDNFALPRREVHIPAIWFWLGTRFQPGQRPLLDVPGLEIYRFHSKFASLEQSHVQATGVGKSHTCLAQGTTRTSSKRRPFLRVGDKTNSFLHGAPETK